MYVYPKSSDRRPKRKKPRVLLVLQGIHHLMLYENFFRYCTEVEWHCVLPSRPKDLDTEGKAEVNRIHYRYDVRFFSDSFAAFAHFAQLDAVITTWSVPHHKHLPYLRYIALAYEVGLPVFELQHGLFQIGLTYSEDAPFTGSGDGVATALPDAPNLVSEVLEWFGEGGIGYPRASSDEGAPADITTRKPRVTFVTNHHWSILEDAERRNCYLMMFDAICRFPEVDFVMLPHGGELKNEDFLAMRTSLDRAGALNHRIESRRFNGVYDTLLRDSDLIVASASTTILDCEMSQTPTVLFRNPSQDGLTGMLHSVVTVESSRELIDVIHDVLYCRYRPELITGFASPFRPDVLEHRILRTIGESSPMPRQDILIAATRYLGMSGSAVTGLA
jgi:hypothetical protein